MWPVEHVLRCTQLKVIACEEFPGSFKALGMNVYGVMHLNSFFGLRSSRYELHEIVVMIAWGMCMRMRSLGAQCMVQ